MKKTFALLDCSKIFIISSFLYLMLKDRSAYAMHKKAHLQVQWFMVRTIYMSLQSWVLSGIVPCLKKLGENICVTVSGFISSLNYSQKDGRVIEMED